MKKILMLLLAFTLSMAGCVTQLGDISLHTVPDLFTQPSSVPQIASKPSSTSPTLPNRDIPEYIGLGFDSKDIRYSGGELHTTIMLTGKGYENVGIGLLLFVDGQPQPYKTMENDTVSYMHIFYPEDRVEYHHELIFIPVTGKVGETVDVHIMGFNDPTFSLGDGEWGAHFSFLSTQTSLTFDEAPPVQELPEVPNAQLNWKCTYVDATDEEMGLINAAQMQQEIQYGFALNGEDREYRFYGAAEGNKVNFHLEVYGMSYVGYSLIIYVEGKPVSVNGEDMMLFDIHNGQKTVIDGEFTLTSFDGRNNVCVLLVPRNSLSCGVQNKLHLEDIEVYYFLSATSYEELLVQINSGEK